MDKNDELEVPTSVGGTPIVDAAAIKFTTSVAKFAFSDVDKALSNNPTSNIVSEIVGIVPFMFVAGESAPVGVKNMTDQLHEYTWGNGEAVAAAYTGNPADEGFTLFPTGRANTSGTRAAVLAETRYGAGTSVIQMDSATTGDASTGTLTGTVSSLGNLGKSSNSFVRDILVRASNTGYLGGNYAFVSYLTVSDAIAATGYDEVTGTISGGEGAKPMTYNGVRYSAENVYNGSYSLWSAQNLYRVFTVTPAEQAFFDLMVVKVDESLTPDQGLKNSLMLANRAGGDGGLITR